ncbi:MAG: hypothetical protein C5B49_01535 [Bdellovibrio sp.]|nr:MAG: hypothetical protein C5B49_01535 [Bdellovibrio sp.]
MLQKSMILSLMTAFELVLVTSSPADAVANAVAVGADAAALTVVTDAAARSRVEAAALDQAEEIAAKIRNDSPYQVLHDAFETASSEINLDDIRTAEKKEKCASASADGSPPANAAVGFRYSEQVIVPGQPAHAEFGPLLPAKPAVPPKVERKNFPLAIFTGDYQETLNALYSSITQQVDQNQVSVTMEQNDKIKISGSPLNFSFRKNDKLLVFKVKALGPGENAFDYYGYCWPKGRSTK